MLAPLFGLEKVLGGVPRILGESKRCEQISRDRGEIRPHARGLYARRGCAL